MTFYFNTNLLHVVINLIFLIVLHVFPFSEASFYQVGKDFKCLTSGQVIPWEFINDDYCDCSDGTDEPGLLLALYYYRQFVSSPHNSFWGTYYICISKNGLNINYNK